MNGIVKLLVDIGPLAVFFIFYTRSDLQTAILPFMIATVIAVLFSYIMEKKIPIMPTVGAGIILVFGGLTIYFDNEVFFKMKPTIINILFALILYGGEVFKKPLLKYLLGGTLKLQEIGWSILTKRWVGFFIALAVLNEIIWRTQSTDIWVNFKVFGILPITFIFTLSQFSTIKKYLIED
ncbi:MAG: putative intracellular septation protein A [Alphaproteobacteria bacterium MarineAlpha5_Bin8]|nr:MAG: putative intracellular septation protein A [Alphaproteobacteria bacterium MarineAlpha5_Bin8]PPR54887.1 MAG: putative intracellular septation protein A [Alphaproteobacteria bacterium MarineAlpha5_Bin6]|tara:strand:- start:104 stop:643 length:540 start_codon:yes stop_codon:yes gene_type:complete